MECMLLYIIRLYFKMYPSMMTNNKPLINKHLISKAELLFLPTFDGVVKMYKTFDKN